MDVVEAEGVGALGGLQRADLLAAVRDDDPPIRLHPHQPVAHDVHVQIGELVERVAAHAGEAEGLDRGGR